jgi:1A family penicillin-binding protein
MPKRAASREFKRENPFYLILLLVQISLILIGRIPLFVLKICWKVIRYLDRTSITFTLLIIKKVQAIHNNPSKINLSFTITSLLSNLSLKSQSIYQAASNYRPLKKRGRPKKKAAFLVFFINLKKIANYLVPFKYRIAIFAIIFFVVTAGSTFFTISFLSVLPSPTRLTNSDHPLTTEFYDRNGKLLYKLYEGRNRSLVKLEQVPNHFVQATIAIEDKNFYKHIGVDLIAILRAINSNINHGSYQGASTITQQLIKNTLLTPERTYTRKIKEVLLSLWTEHLYTKDQILTMYLNEAPYGGPAWGVKTAAETYFGKQPNELTLAESAYLAGLPASPTEYSPYGTHPELAKQRQKEVLRRMVEDKYITQQEADDAFKQELAVLPPNNEIYAPHFVMYVKNLLSEKYGARVISQGGLKITTTIDLGLQESIQQIVKDEVDKLSNLNVSNGAAMITDPKTGQVLAMVGSLDYYKEGFGNYNVTLSLRQPGSSIKPVTYATAFKLGFTPGNTILDAPVSFPDGDKKYSPVNYDGRFHGPVSIRTALGSSYNIPAVKTLARVGITNMIQTSKDLGVTTFTDPKRYGLSLTLGGGEVTMMDMMSVYGTFSQNGIKHPITPILKITDSNGNTLEEYQDHSTQVLQPEIAYLITNILADNHARTPAFGPNSLLNIPKHQVAVKTGTTDNKKDNWTFGYTPDFVVGVWVGNNDNTPMNPALTSGVTGAAPIWNRIMKGLLAKIEPNNFKRPLGVVDVLVDGRRDIGVAGLLPKALVRIERKSDQTLYFDPYSSYATSSATAAISSTRVN